MEFDLPVEDLNSRRSRNLQPFTEPAEPGVGRDGPEPTTSKGMLDLRPEVWRAEISMAERVKRTAISVGQPSHSTRLVGEPVERETQ
jgi:hypothetical protein